MLAAAFVTHEHFVSALAAPNDAAQQRSSVARDAAALGAQVLTRLSRSMVWIFSKVSHLM
jgi:hypothetical protein